jgi:adenylosuccinate synthase
VKRLVLLSGHIGSGKSELATGLVEQYGARHVKTRRLLEATLGGGKASSRESLQAEGERLDRRTSGAWLAEAIARDLAREDSDLVVVDAVRRLEQVDAIRAAFGARVTHIHLTAPPEVLEARFKRRRRAGEPPSYADASADETEAQVETLAPHADIVIDTARSTTEDVRTRAYARLGLFGPRAERLVDVLVGGGYGSEGKGHIAAYLAKEYGLLVRVGGPNAGHSVMWESGPYTHHLLPSGTRTSDAQLLLAPGAVLRVPNLLKEISDCGVEVGRLWIDPQAMIVTDEDREKEKELVAAIGSTGQGTGAATARRIFEGRVTGRSILAEGIPELRPYLRKASDVLDEAYARGTRIFVEGTQGSSLSIYHGAYPYVTSRDTNVAGALSEAGISPTRVRRVVLVMRTYPIRVQSPKGKTSGPMSKEISWAEVARRSGLNVERLRRAERTSTTNRRRRVAEFDWLLLHSAAALNGPTDIALTFADYLAASNQNARRFEQLTSETIQFIEEIESVAGAPVSLISTRFHARSIIDRRDW